MSTESKKSSSSSRIQVYHNKLVKYGFCTPGDQFVGLKLFALFGKIILQDKYQNAYVDPINSQTTPDAIKESDDSTSYLNINSLRQQDVNKIYDDEKSYTHFKGGNIVYDATLAPSVYDRKHMDDSNYARFMSHLGNLYHFYVNDSDKLERNLKKDGNLGDDISNDINLLKLIYQHTNFEEVYDIYQTVDSILSSSSDLQGLYDEFTEKRSKKNKKQGNTQFTPQCVSQLMAKLALKYIKMVRGDGIYVTDDDYSPMKYSLLQKEGLEEARAQHFKDVVHEHSSMINYKTGISIVDAGSGYNALTNAMLDECMKHRIKINHLRAYEIDSNVANVAELALTKKLYDLHKNYNYDVCISADNVGPVSEKAFVKGADDTILHKGAMSTAAKVLQDDYLALSDEELLPSYATKNDLIDITVSNPP